MIASWHHACDDGCMLRLRICCSSLISSHALLVVLRNRTLLVDEARSSNHSGCIVALTIQVEDVAPPLHACQPVFAKRLDYAGVGIDIAVIN